MPSFAATSAAASYPNRSSNAAAVSRSSADVKKEADPEKRMELLVTVIGYQIVKENNGKWVKAHDDLTGKFDLNKIGRAHV